MTEFRDLPPGQYEATLQVCFYAHCDQHRRVCHIHVYRVELPTYCTDVVQHMNPGPLTHEELCANVAAESSHT